MHVITNVETTAATTADNTMLPHIHAHLAARDLLPQDHIVDMGYMSTDQLLAARTQGVALVGPLRADCSWQTQAGAGYGIADFTIDWEHQQAICPRGCFSQIWKSGTESDGHAIIDIRFAHQDCAPCPSRPQCVSSARPRALHVRHQEVYEVSTQARQSQKTDTFKATYAKRAGVEGTLSQGVRRSDLRRTRFVGLDKTRLQHVVTATALNLLRLSEWLLYPQQASTRTPPFAALTQQAA